MHRIIPPSTPLPIPRMDRPPPARVTVNEAVYHQRHNKQPTQIVSRYSRSLKATGLPWVCECTVSELWSSPFDDCGIHLPGMVVIQNLEGQFTQRVPTEEEKKIAESKVVEVVYYIPPPEDFARDMHSPPRPPGVYSPPWLIPPGESMRGLPGNLGQLRMRCESGAARLIIHVLPG